MSLPAAARNRWGIAAGGSIGYLDLGDAVVLLRGGVEDTRRDLIEGVTEADWAEARAGFGDPDLADE